MPIVEIKEGFDVMISQGARIIITDNQDPKHYWAITVTVLLGLPSFNFQDLGTTKPT